MKKNLVAASAITSLIALTSLCAIGKTNLDNFAAAPTNYTCAHLYFGEKVDNPGSTTNIACSKIANMVNLTDDDVTLTSWTCSNYKAKSGEALTSAIKLGGSKSGKYDGAVTLTLNNYTCDQVIISAAEWSNDPEGASLYVNDIGHELPQTTDGNYQFKDYTYTLDNLSSFSINNGIKNDKHRIVISKILLRIK